MTNDKLRPDYLPAHESGVRRMIADSDGSSYRAFLSLAEAKAAPDGVVVFEADDGGQIYLVVPARHVHCSEDLLWQLLVDIDARVWNDLSMARVFFEAQPVGSEIAGGMGGGLVADGLWVHPRLVSLHDSISAVLSGKANSLRVE